MRQLVAILMFAGLRVFASSANAAPINVLARANNTTLNYAALSIWFGGAGGHGGWSVTPTPTPPPSGNTGVVPLTGSIPLPGGGTQPTSAVPEPTAALLFAAVAASRKRFN